MANKSTQYFRLHKLLESANTCSKETVAKELGVDIKSVPVYIHALKHKFKAEIETVKKGRQVIAYKLMNKDKLKVPKFRSNATSGLVKTADVVEIKGEDGSVPILDEDLEIAQHNEREIEDVHTMLGIDEPGHNSD